MEQPDKKIQKVYDDIMSRTPDVVTICGKKHEITWLHNGTARKFSHIMLTEENPWKRNVKVCAVVLLNKKHGLLTCFLLWSFYWIYWRWLYYVKDIDQTEIMGVLNASKKKIQSEPLAMATILATGMMDTLMMMAKHEYTQAEQSGD